MSIQISQALAQNQLNDFMATDLGGEFNDQTARVARIGGTDQFQGVATVSTDFQFSGTKFKRGDVAHIDLDTMNIQHAS